MSDAAANAADDGDAGERHAGERRLAVAAITLGGVAGYVDIVGWILLSHIYVANMSGNTIAFGRSLARHDLRDAGVRMWPVFLFVLGLFGSELVYEVARRNGRRSRAGWTLALEAAAIAFVTILP